MIKTVDLVTEFIMFEEAPFASGWTPPMAEEFDSLIKKKTWELTELPPGSHTLSAKWVYKSKLINDRISPLKMGLKVWLVAHGFEQQYGIDYTETLAPVLRWQLFKGSNSSTLQPIATTQGWPISHMDVVAAFFDGTLHEVIYMHQHQGFVQKGSAHFVCKLCRSLYGLKRSTQACRYQEIDSFLRS